MKRTLIISTIAILLGVALFGYFGWLRQGQAEQNTASQNLPPAKASINLIAAPGVVEAVSEEIEVGAEISGKLKEVKVTEGDQVARGQIIAILENDDFLAQVTAAKTNIETLRRQQETAKAKLLQAEAEKLRLINGARPQERRQAQAEFEQTLPVVENSRREADRRKKLFEAGDISREDYERANRDFEIAVKRSQEMRENFAVVNAAARTDEVQKADAGLQFALAQIREFDALIVEAQARVEIAIANLAKTVVRAPVAGIVLRRRLQTGESFSTDNSNNGIVTIGDVSALRVRVDVDEADVANIKENQSAYVTAAAYGKQQFVAKVVKIGQILGRKNIRTDEPTEKVDRKILEILLELEPGQRLPLGLRVDAFIKSE